MKNQIKFVLVAYLLLFSTCSKSDEIANGNQKNAEWNLMVWAFNKTGKECKFEGESTANTFLSTWQKITTEYEAKEKFREQNYKNLMSDISTTLTNTTSGNPSDNSQLGALFLQIKTIDLGMEYLWMGGYGRVTQRQEMNSIFKELQSIAEYDHNKFIESYEEDFLNGLKEGLRILTDSCEKEKYSVCEEAKKTFNLIFTEYAINYKSQYDSKFGPSKDLNLKMQEIESKMLSSIESLSENESHSWKTHGISTINKMISARKSLGISCPESEESIGLSDAVKIMKIIDNKNKTQTEKIESLKKDNLSNIAPGLNDLISLQILRDLPKYWDLQNNLIGLASGRRDLVSDIFNRMIELNKSDMELYQKFVERRAIIMKLMMAYDDLSKNKLDLVKECGNSDQVPYGCRITPSLSCDLNALAKFRYYQICKERVDTFNAQLQSLGKVSDKIKKNPNLVGFEPRSTGPWAKTLFAKIKSADGTFSYEPLIENAQGSGPCTPGAFVVGPSECSGQATSPAVTSSKNIVPPVNESSKSSSKINETYGSTNSSKSIPSGPKFESKINKSDKNKLLNSKEKCGLISSASSKRDKDQNEACIKEVNNHNSLIDAKINLSNYLKKNQSFVEIAIEPVTNLVMAKMKSEDNTDYFLPLNFDSKNLNSSLSFDLSDSGGKFDFCKDFYIKNSWENKESKISANLKNTDNGFEIKITGPGNETKSSTILVDPVKMVHPLIPTIYFTKKLDTQEVLKYQLSGVSSQNMEIKYFENFKATLLLRYEYKFKTPNTFDSVLVGVGCGNSTSLRKMNLIIEKQ